MSTLRRNEEDFLCVYGFIHEYQTSINKMDLIIPNVIIEIIIKFYEIITDIWDPNNCFYDFTITNKTKIERNMQDYGWRNGYGIDIVSKMQKRRWKFRILNLEKESFYCYLGIVEHYKILKGQPLNGKTHLFDYGDSDEGWNLPLQDLSTVEWIDQYGLKTKVSGSVKKGDIIEMELDMTINNGTKGQLTYFYNGNISKNDLNEKFRTFNWSKSYNMGIAMHGSSSLEIIK